MELSPELLTTVAFREQWRGYSQPEVDEFLERVAVAVGELQQRLRDAADRASDAERKLLDRSEEDEIRRTLLLAQRTAGQVVEEARAEAERILADADAAAAEKVAEAERRALSQEVEIADRERRELGELASRRNALQADVNDLTFFLEQSKGVLRVELARLLQSLDEGPLAPKEAPQVSDVVVASFEPPAEPEPALEPIALAPAPPSWSEPEPAAGVDEPNPWAPPGFFDDAAGGPPTGEVDVVLDEPAGPDPEAPPAGALGVPEPVHFDGVDDAVEGAEIDDDAEHDPFLAELRRAVTDTEPLGPRDHDPSEAIPTSDAGDDAGGRFRLRRNRS